MIHLFSGFFQLGYVTRELDAAIERFRRRFGNAEFLIYDPDAQDGIPPPTRRIALAYIDDVMIEIIEPDKTRRTIFDDALPETVGPMALHHLGYLISDTQAAMQKLSELGYSIPVHGSVPGMLDFMYADARADAGHYLEFIRQEEAGRAFFAAAPRLRMS